jgi:hypothetical protein
MALIAEEIVQEWLNRKGYFTIRGIKLGNHEIDILAVKANGQKLDCRHVEVQVSHNPIAYITDSKPTKKSAAELAASVTKWIEKKFSLPDKASMRKKLAPGEWTRELVYNQVSHNEELDELQRQGITLHKFAEVVSSMRSPNNIVHKAVGADLLDLFLFATPDDEEARK